MPLAVNDIVQLTVEQEKENSTVLAVLHFRVTTAPSTGTPAENLAAFADFLFDNPGGFYTDEWLACLATDHVIRATRAQVVAPVRGAYVEELRIWNGTCVNEGLETANLAWVVVKQTELAGRRGRGTLHMTMPSYEWFTTGRLNLTGSTQRAALANKLDDLCTVPAGGVLEPVIYHPGFSPNFHRITHTTVKQEVRVMRRRTAGHGI